MHLWLPGTLNTNPTTPEALDAWALPSSLLYSPVALPAAPLDLCSCYSSENTFWNKLSPLRVPSSRKPSRES